MTDLIPLAKKISMKHLFIVVYFITVMLVSGLSQAQQIPSVVAPVTYAQFIPSTQHVLIQGKLSNPCQLLPRAEVISIDHEKRSISVAVRAKMTSEMCIAVLGKNYDILLDVGILGLHSGVEYKLIINKSSTIEPISVVASSDVHILPEGEKEILLKGQLILTSTGSLLKTGRGFHKLSSDSISLKQYANEKVVVTGIESHNSISPISNSNIGLPKNFKVTGIASSSN